jgi:uncharacterized protein YndB with AHSA1/START domain
MEKDRIEREVLIEAPIDHVWDMLTKAEHLGTWFADDGAEVDLREGGAIELRWKEYGATRARIERIEPKRTLAFRWAPYKDPGGIEPEAGNSTRVEFTLDGDADRTVLKVVETGFASLDTDPEQRLRNFEGNTEGWERELGELVDYARAKLPA